MIKKYAMFQIQEKGNFILMKTLFMYLVYAIKQLYLGQKWKIPLELNSKNVKKY